MVQFEFDISSEINRIQQQLNKLIEQVTAHVWDRSLDREQFYPSVDVYENPKSLIVQVELPGVSASSIHIYGMGGALYVKGVKEADYPPPGEVLFHVFERRFGKFEVRVGIPCPVQLGNARATYSDGIVRVELPKIEERRLRKCLVPLSVLECD